MGVNAESAPETSVELRRLGLIVPSSNTTAERDFVRSVPEGVSVHTARAHMADTTVSAERKMLASYVPQAVTDLATAKVHAIVFSCTSAAALLGKAGEDRLVEELGQSARATVISTNEAVARVLGRYDGARVAVVTAYIDELNMAIAKTLTERGVSVSSIVGMDMVDNFAIAEVRPDQIVAFAEEHTDPQEFDVLFVSCTNLRAMEAREVLEARVGRPVVTSNSAALAVALEFLEGMEPAIHSAQQARPLG